LNRTTAIFATVLVAALGLSLLALRRLDQLRAGATLEDALYIPSPHVLKRMSLGYDGLLADVYWTRAVQYFGRKHHVGAEQYDQLGPLLDITTELDPHLVVAYQFGSIFLAQKPPEGAGQPEKAIALVERGIRENPADWRLYFNLGWIEYDRRNYTAASHTFERGAKVTGAPSSMSVLAAATAQGAGNIQTAKLLWLELYNSTKDKEIRATAVRRLEALRVDEEVSYLEEIVQKYRDATGHAPRSWNELESYGWRGPTVDPAGHAYLLKPDGRVEVYDPGEFPFITRGLPAGRKPLILGPAVIGAKGKRESAEPKR
jgi:tetratricopeptide (TPR) repeat protein